MKNKVQNYIHAYIHTVIIYNLPAVAIVIHLAVMGYVLSYTFLAIIGVWISGLPRSHDITSSS